MRTLLTITAVMTLFGAGCGPLFSPPADPETARLERESRALDAEMKRDPQPLGEGWPSECPVHGTPLREDVVRIRYGLPAEFALPEWREAHRNRFPYAQSHVWGGCMIWRGQPKRAHTMYCPTCRTEQATWMRESFEPAWRRVYSGPPIQGSVGGVVVAPPK
jgi:hypothetical protein